MSKQNIPGRIACTSCGEALDVNISIMPDSETLRLALELADESAKCDIEVEGRPRDGFLNIVPHEGDDQESIMRLERAYKYLMMRGKLIHHPDCDLWVKIK